MRSTILGALLASALVLPALAQSASDRPSPPAQTPPSATTQPAPANATQSGMWRASKLVGLNVYNEQNEKLGDISEILLDKSGKVQGVVIGVGGFLGMGQRDIKVEMSKLKFMDEPARTASTSSTTNTTGTATTGTGTTRSSNDRKWYPDHAVLAGANKDQLKNMPEFKYD